MNQARKASTVRLASRRLPYAMVNSLAICSGSGLLLDSYREPAVCVTLIRFQNCACVSPSRARVCAIFINIYAYGIDNGNMVGAESR